MSGREPPLLNYKEKYQWCTIGQNCPLCNAMRGRVYELDIYITSTVYPGYVHPNCNCYLKKVPIETPQSDLDIFGSSLNMRNDSWLNMLFGSFENLWTAGNVTMTREIMNVSDPGMTFGQALLTLRSQDKTGIFQDYGGLAGSFDYGWNIYHNTSLDIYQSINDCLTSISGLFPRATSLRAEAPTQTYHNTIYHLGW